MSGRTPNAGITLYHKNRQQIINGSKQRNGGSNLKRTRKKKLRN
jgi:hypothetical protein